MLSTRAGTVPARFLLVPRMKLVVGLGNPGAEHAGNRHNVGFMAVDAIADANGFPPWRSRFQGKYTEGLIGGGKVGLLKPGTYMNLSGQAVGEAARYFKLTAPDIIVLHDELDLAPGKCRLKTGGGHAGHNGLRSLHQHIGDGYHRLRIGIGHPGHKDAVSGYVLRDFSKADQIWLEPLLQAIGTASPFLISGDAGRLLNAISPALIAPPAKPATANVKKAPPDQQADARTPLQRLADRFLGKG